MQTLRGTQCQFCFIRLLKCVHCALCIIVAYHFKAIMLFVGLWYYKKVLPMPLAAPLLPLAAPLLPLADPLIPLAVPWFFYNQCIVGPTGSRYEKEGPILCSKLDNGNDEFCQSALAISRCNIAAPWRPFQELTMVLCSLLTPGILFVLYTMQIKSSLRISLLLWICILTFEPQVSWGNWRQF